MFANACGYRDRNSFPSGRCQALWLTDGAAEQAQRRRSVGSFHSLALPSEEKEPHIVYLEDQI